MSDYSKIETKTSYKKAEDLGLTKSEYQKIKEILNREPNFTELCIFSAMWSEHCSYKSSKKWLKTMNFQNSSVICGPGENAGVIDIGNGLAAVFKMESHNHPSYIDPYQGAATGVGGILRDVFTMGARPIANLNSIRFGDPSHPKTKYLIEGVVAGIGGYGNCVGIPTVGGETYFNENYNNNILVNAMTVGIVSAKKIFYSKASGVGNPVIYVGSKTGRDGIHGASMASAEFDQTIESKRPTVQVGDPFTEKLLLEACLELMKSDSIVAIQDMGAAGLTSSSFEMASKGNLGIEINLDKVPQREKNMKAFELMLSESQERMLIVVKKGKEKEAEKVFLKWELPFSIIGRLTDSGNMVLYKSDKIVANLPISPLVSEAPEYDRKWKRSKHYTQNPIKKLEKLNLKKNLIQLISSPNLSSKKWVWQQYDHMVMTNTIIGPGSDAAVVRIERSDSALAITTDCNPKYVSGNPKSGSKQAVAESWRNLICVGAKPIAITDCLNFGNPEKPEIMGQIVESIEGIKEATEVLNFPVISGNVSLYNETEGKSILPTPQIGAVGVINDISNIASIIWNENELIYILGKNDIELGCSAFDEIIEKTGISEPPTINLKQEKKVGSFVLNKIQEGLIKTCHDISDGGILIALAEMAINSKIGAKIDHPKLDTTPLEWWFSETQARFIVSIPKNQKAVLEKEAVTQNVPILHLGIVKGNTLQINKEMSISLQDLENHNSSWLPGYINS